MAGKPRTVYLYEPYLLTPKGEVKDVPNGIWKEILDAVEKLGAGDRIKTVSGHAHRGATRSTKAPAARFLYIGRRRDPADWPDHAKDGADELPLSIDGELVEPMYLLPLTGTNYVATLRTSAGPQPSSSAAWISAIIKPADGMEFCLRPVVRRDALNRLLAADQVSSVEVKIDEFSDVPDSDGTFAAALKEMQTAGGTNATITVAMSYGHKTADSSTSQSIIKGLGKMLRTTAGLRKASAKVSELGADGKVQKTQLDFFNDRIAQRVSVGKSTKESQTPEVVMAAMYQAIEHFRSNLEVIRKGGVTTDVEDDDAGDTADDADGVPAGTD